MAIFYGSGAVPFRTKRNEIRRRGIQQIMSDFVHKRIDHSAEQAESLLILIRTFFGGWKRLFWTLQRSTTGV
jgi:hypothetical protein